MNDSNVSPLNNVLFLTNFVANDDSGHLDVSETLNPLSLQIYSPPDPGFHQRRYSDSELDDLVSFDDETTVYSLQDTA